MKKIKTYNTFFESRIARLARDTNKFKLIYNKDNENSLWVYNDTTYIFCNSIDLFIFREQPNYNDKEEVIQNIKNYNHIDYSYEEDLSIEENLFNYYLIDTNCEQVLFIGTSIGGKLIMRGKNELIELIECSLEELTTFYNTIIEMHY